MNDALDRARHEGRNCGYVDDGQVRDCVYAHAEMTLRREWLAGFAEGRMQRRKEVGLTPAGVDPGRRG